MGLLSKIFGRERPAQTQQQNLVSGDIEYKVYVYDPQPLMQLQQGFEFVAGIPTGRVRLRSTTGGTWDSNKDDGIAFSFNGVPFGVSFNEDLARLIRSNGFNSITMRHLGWYDRTHQEIRALAPSTRVSEVQRIAGELLHRHPTQLTENEDFVSLNNGGIQQEMDAYLGRGDRKRFTAYLELIPTPEGSSAKPHVKVSDADTGTRLFETSARMSGHTWLLAHMGQTMPALVTRVTSDDEGYYMNVVLASSGDATNS
jgi:hypothetical protein